MILEKEINALVKKGIYKDKEKIYADALRLFLGVDQNFVLKR